MIIDIFENIKKYESLNKNFKFAFDYILNTDFSLLSVGKYEILNNDVYASVDEYETKTVSRPEYHKKYIDIQFLVEGKEFIGYCKKNDLYNLEKFDEQKDIGFADGRVDLIKMGKNQFMILFPDDAHQPCMAIESSKKVKKVVVKVKVS